MSLRCIRLIQQLNSRLSNFRLSQSGQLNQLQPCVSISHLVKCRYSTSTPTDQNSGQSKKAVDSLKPEKVAESSKSEDSQLSELSDEPIEKQTKEEDREQLAKDGNQKKKRERYAVNTYSHNPPGLMEFFDDPKNWGEDYVKSGRPWKVEELRNKSNSDLHKLWYVLLKERNMLLTMQEAYHRATDPLPSEERIWKVNDSMSNLEQVVRERNKAYWQLEVDQNETGQRPVAFRKDIFGRYRWITCSEHFVPLAMNKNWRLFSGQGTGRHVYEFMRRYREKQVNKRTVQLHKQAFHVRQTLRRFPRLDMEALQEKYPMIDVEAQRRQLDVDQRLRRTIPKFFRS